ncbi:MFS transporter [Streptomyces cinereoruber]|uniref:MFS transporter n=1 Tax=Streptomyces cinereoruber TaxID=67260 RepID=A0ABX6BNY4_9ACTN|nr:MFS transporter [Streptomyces cinereoruber]MBB4162373.1 putative MFS family arabinose efflux permease [Streptomyces cinereoruber]MBY8820155.1 MFS transporter [Streptomyces cinereoruber]NIH63477.1 putative MFS family arabinose efflux permease [Streptomyces cinereoruber]QEV36117.1 MFS transporter [Streptomyces cinereoruber]
MTTNDLTTHDAPVEPEPGPPPSPWRSSRFRLFFTARSTSLLADGMLMVSLTTAVLGAGYGASGVGYALAAWMAPIVLLVLFGGVLADRFTPQVMMVGADVVRMVAMLALAGLLALGDVRLWHVMALLAVSGAATAMFQPGLASLVPRVAEDIQRANALLRISESICTLLGPGLAGLLVAYWDVAGSFLVIAGFYACSALGLAPLRRLGTAPDGTDEPIWQRLATGWHEFRSRSWLWGVIAVWAVYGLFVFGPALPLGAALLTEQHGADGYGWIASADGAGTIVGGLLGMRVRPRRPLVAGACAMFFFSLNPLAPALGWSFGLTAATGVLAGCGFAFWGVMWATSVQSHIPLAVLSRVSAYDVAGSIMVIPVGRALAGPAAESVGADRVLLFSSVMGLVCIAVMLAVPAVRALRRAPEKPSGADRAVADG